MKDFTTSYEIASCFITDNPNWNLHWRNPKKLIESYGWEIFSYKKKEWKKLSTEAYCSFKYENFFIPYCEDNYSTRITYNIHHECGHIISGHPILFRDILCKSSKDTEKKFLEQSATVVGRNVFLPAYVIDYIKKTACNLSEEIIKKYFQETYILSNDYINARFDFLEEDLKHMKYPKIIQNEACKEYGNFLKWYIKRYGIKNSYLP